MKVYWSQYRKKTIKRQAAKQLFWHNFFKSRSLYAMMILPTIYYIIFCYVPMAGILVAFKDYNVYQGFFDSPWVGFKYFQDFLTDPYFYKVFRNTFVLGIYQIIFSFPMPIIFALLLNEIRGRYYKRMVQTISYLPHFLSTVIVCGMIVNFLVTDGLINECLQMIGLPAEQYLMKPQYFRTIYILSDIWQSMGWGSIIYLAALNGIDMEQYEAAKIDGATRFQQLRAITLPGIMPTIVIMFIFKVGAIMSIGFEKIILLYNGATYETADVISTYVYRRGLAGMGNDFSYATAVGLFNSVISMFMLIVANYISKKAGETSLW